MNDSNFINPIVKQRADPWVYKHTDGYYYFTASVPEYNRIEIRRAKIIQELGTALPVVAWKKYPDGIMSVNIWAPKIHFIEGKWKDFLTYSASATDFHYCMGMLQASDKSDLLNPASWAKSEKPIFQTDDKSEQYGPGHNCFTVTPDGINDVLVYHARDYKEIQGDPLYDPNRHTRAQILHWNNDGTPNFGTPVADGEISKLKD